jgi:hypothetical protein
MSTSTINDSQRAALIGILLDDPALVAAEQTRRDRAAELGLGSGIPQGYSGDPYSDGDDMAGGFDAAVGDDADAFVGLLDPNDPVTDQFPAIDPAAVELDPVAEALGDADALDDDEEIAATQRRRLPPPPSNDRHGERRQSITERVNLRHPLLWIAAATVVVTVVAVMLSGGGGNPSSLTITEPTESAAVQPGEPASVDRDGPIRVASAVSRCPTGSSNPMLAFDQKMETAWVCVRAWGVDGQILDIDLGGVFEISQIGIVPGWNKSNSDGSDEWQNHRTVAKVTYQFNDTNRSQWVQETRSARELVMTKTTGSDDAPILASHVKITINQTASTTGGQRSGDSESATDFAVSEIQIIGRVPE